MRFPRPLGLLIAGSNVTIGLLYHSPVNYTIGAMLLALLAHDWWNRRGKRTMRLLGAKSRALLGKLAAGATPQEAQ